MSVEGEVKKKEKHPLYVPRIPVKDPEFMSEVPERLKNKDFPGFPSTSVFVGMPGSGKTNTFIHMLTSPLFWNKFFDKIYLFGPTVKSDQLYEIIKVPDEQIVADQNEFLPKLKEALDQQQAMMESSKSEAPKLLFVFEDITSYYDKIQKKPEFARCYTQVRHLKGCSVSMVHKYKAFNRTARMSTQHILVWKCNKTEIKQLYEDFGPTSLTEKEWFDLVRYCHEPTEDCDKPFLYINMFAPEKTRFRKCFTEILELEDAVLEGKKLAKEDGSKSEESKLLGKRKTLDAAPTPEARRKKEETLNKIIEKEVEYF
jgi:hypothetical protein